MEVSHVLVSEVAGRAPEDLGQDGVGYEGGGGSTGDQRAELELDHVGDLLFRDGLSLNHLIMLLANAS